MFDNETFGTFSAAFPTFKHNASLACARNNPEDYESESFKSPLMMKNGINSSMINGGGVTSTSYNHQRVCFTEQKPMTPFKNSTNDRSNIPAQHYNGVFNTEKKTQQ